MNEEYDGGTVMNDCPHCGQFCKIPEFYEPYFKQPLDKNSPNRGMFLGDTFLGCYADSYCKRCGKDVKLPVEFL